MKNEVNEKVKPIVLRDTETKDEYTLEFDKESVRFAEERGFKISEVGDFPMTGTHDLFFYAFRKHHRNISRQKTDKMLDEELGGIGNLPEGFLERLYLLYNEPFKGMVDGESGKNVKMQIEM